MALAQLISNEISAPGRIMETIEHRGRQDIRHRKPEGPKQESLTSGVVLFQPSERNWFAASLLIQSELDNEILELGCCSRN